MGFMPVPTEQFFKDFAFDILQYSVQRSSREIAAYGGLTNKDEDGRYIGFKMDSDIQVGDVLIRDNRQYVVRMIDYDHYNGKPDMLKAYY